MDKPEGDCAIFSECVAAFLTVFGVPYEFVTVAVNPNEPTIFSHVYLYGVMPDGSRLPLDASHGQYPGWQVPSAHVSRRQVWDASGNPVADQGSRFAGLHNYSLRGLGDPCNYGDPDYDAAICEGTMIPGAGSGSSTLNLSALYPVNPAAYVTSAGTPYSGSAVTAPAQNSAQWASFATCLAKMGMTLASINSIQPGTVVGADGTILRQNPGYAVGTPTIASNLGMSTSTLLIAALVIGGVFMM